jgi:hypothetical protein
MRELGPADQLLAGQEVGTLTYLVHDAVTAPGARLLSFNAAPLRMIAASRKKTDRRDAYWIAKALQSGMYPHPVYSWIQRMSVKQVQSTSPAAHAPPPAGVSHTKPVQQGVVSPQCWPASAHRLGVVVVDVLVVVVVVVIPQTFGVPPPPHTSGAAQSPQKSVSGQVPSLMSPQLAPTAAQLIGVQHVPRGRLPNGAVLMQTPPQHL